MWVSYVEGNKNRELLFSSLVKQVQWLQIACKTYSFSTEWMLPGKPFALLPPSEKRKKETIGPFSWNSPRSPSERPSNSSNMKEGPLRACCLRVIDSPGSSLGKGYQGSSLSIGCPEQSRTNWGFFLSYYIMLLLHGTCSLLLVNNEVQPFCSEFLLRALLINNPFSEYLSSYSGFRRAWTSAHFLTMIRGGSRTRGVYVTW